MVDMRNASTTIISKGCDPTVAEAIKQFHDQWQPYSASSRQHPIVRLIEELIDPAVVTYTAKLPLRYVGHIPGAGTGVGLSGIIRLIGFDAMVRLQRELLRKFIRQEDCTSARDKRFTATLESLFDLIWACACKQPAESPIRGSDGKPRGLNGRRRQGFCRFCGELTALASFAGDESQLRGATQPGTIDGGLEAVRHQEEDFDAPVFRAKSVRDCRAAFEQRSTAADAPSSI